MAETTALDGTRQHPGSSAPAAPEAAAPAAPDGVAGSQHLLDLAQDSEQQGRADDAEKIYLQAADLAPKDPEPHYRLGAFYYEQGRLDEARAEFEEFLERSRWSTARQDIDWAKQVLAERWGVKYEKCATCGSISSLTRFYRPVYRRTLCPRCAGRARIKHTAPSPWLLLVLLLLVVLAYPLSRQFHYLYANIALFFLSFIPLIIPHELGHALATWLLGGRVFEVRIGVGPVLWERPIGRTTLVIARYPVSGRCAAAFPSRDHLRLRTFVVIAAGMAANAALIGLLAPHFQATHLVTRYAPVEVLLIANVLILASGLWPGKYIIDGMELASDGMQLWQLARGRMAVDGIHLGYFNGEGVYAARRKAYGDAVRAAEEGLALYPGSTILENLRAVALMSMDRHAEARAAFQSMLSHFEAAPPGGDVGLDPAMHPVMEAMLLNNVAYATLLAAPGGEALQSALDQARRSYRLMPWEPYIEGTWGAVLMEAGRLRAGTAHLLAAAEQHDMPRSKAINLAHAAVGTFRLGDAAEARALLDRAVALDPSPYEVRRAQKILSC